MRQKYRDAYREIRLYWNANGVGSMDHAVWMMSQFGLEATRNAIISHRERDKCDSYSVPFKWRTGHIPF